jgi:hypothetical protein
MWSISGLLSYGKGHALIYNYHIYIHVGLNSNYHIDIGLNSNYHIDVGLNSNYHIY